MPTTIYDYVEKRINDYGRRAAMFRTAFTLLRSAQVVIAAAIPIVAWQVPVIRCPFLMASLERSL